MTNSEVVKGYMHHLNLEAEAPSHRFLEKICTAQLNTFPFENIGKLLHQQSSSFTIPSFEKFVSNFQKFNFGGTCYTLNANLLLLLRALGFDCHHVMLGNEHMGIVVILDDAFYVDCGAAAPFFKPVRLNDENNNNVRFGKDEVSILPVDSKDSDYKYIRYTNGKQSGKVWHFQSTEKANINDFQKVIEESYKPDATFMTILRCQLYQTNLQRSVSLVNNKFSIRYENGEIETTALNTKQEIMAVMADEFFLPKLPVEEAVDALERRGIDIFS